MEITTETTPATTETGGAESAAATEAPDVGKLIGEFGSRLDGLTEQITGIGQRLEQPPEEEPEETSEEVSLPQYGVEDFDEHGALDPAAQAREMQRIAGEIADQRVAGMQAKLDERDEEAAWERRDTQAEALEKKYPDLADDTKQDYYLGIAKELAESLGKPDLAIEPEWLERVYLSEKAKETAGDEIPAGNEQGVHVERGGAAAAAATTSGEDDGDRIVALAGKKRHRI